MLETVFKDMRGDWVKDVESDEFWSQVCVLQWVAVGCSGLQWVAVGCSGV